MKYGRMMGLVVAALALTGCASLADPKATAPLTKVILADVTANERLYNVGDTPPGPKTASVITLTVTEEITNHQAVGWGEGLLAKALADAWKSGYLTKEALVATSAYKKLVPFESTDNGTKIIRANGYKPLGLFSNDDGVRKISAELGADGVVTAHFLFQTKLMSGFMGTGTMGAQTTLRVKFYDSKAKVLYEKEFVGTSNSTVPAVAGVFETAKFQGPLSESAQNAVDLLTLDIARR